LGRVVLGTISAPFFLAKLPLARLSTEPRRRFEAERELFGSQLISSWPPCHFGRCLDFAARIKTSPSFCPSPANQGGF